MDKQRLVKDIRNLSFAFLALVFALSCTTTKEVDVLDRTAVPEVRADMPVTVSEIREVKFQKTASESGHQVLHLKGMLFTKSASGGSTQIRPCSGCVVKMTSPADTSIAANLTTQSDGYFEFNGILLPYTFTTNTPGMNPLVIEGVEFEKEGFSTLKVVQAAGSTPERFRVTKTSEGYTWTKLQ
jgi:hypothetical protein